MSSRAVCESSLKPEYHIERTSLTGGSAESTTSRFICSSTLREVETRPLSNTTTRMHWSSPPNCVLVIKKPSEEVLDAFISICRWMKEKRGLHVMVEPSVYEEVREYNLDIYTWDSCACRSSSSSPMPSSQSTSSSSPASHTPSSSPPASVSPATSPNSAPVCSSCGRPSDANKMKRRKPGAVSPLLSPSIPTPSNFPSMPLSQPISSFSHVSPSHLTLPTFGTLNTPSSPSPASSSGLSSHVENLEEEEQWVCSGDDLHECVDFVVCLGGDGTLLWAASLFKKAVPPIISFGMGSLGFLTVFQVDNFEKEIDAVLKGGFMLTLRQRLHAQIVRQDGSVSPPSLALNEVVVDRGPCPYITTLDCFADNVFVTTVQADGIIIATPTGSTAYSLSAGGSIVHPNVPAILFTPICPHSLSFRPVLFPDTVTLKLQVPLDARASAWVSIDGRDRMELKKGDCVIIRSSAWSLPCVCRDTDMHDWLVGVIEGLNWNVRQRQKSLLQKRYSVCEE